MRFGSQSTSSQTIWVCHESSFLCFLHPYQSESSIWTLWRPLVSSRSQFSPARHCRHHLLSCSRSGVSHTGRLRPLCWAGLSVSSFLRWARTRCFMLPEDLERARAVDCGRSGLWEREERKKGPGSFCRTLKPEHRKVHQHCSNCHYNTVIVLILLLLLLLVLLLQLLLQLLLSIYFIYLSVSVTWWVCSGVCGGDWNPAGGGWGMDGGPPGPSGSWTEQTESLCRPDHDEMTWWDSGDRSPTEEQRETEIVFYCVWWEKYLGGQHLQLTNQQLDWSVSELRIRVGLEREWRHVHWLYRDSFF